MDLAEERFGDTAVISVTGRVDSANARAFETALVERIASCGSAVVLDLGRLDYVSSAGLRVILVVAKQLRGRGTGFALCSLEPQVREVFEISGFDRIIRICASRAVALADT